MTKRTTKSGSAWVIGKTILAGIAGLLVLKAIELGDVSLVQALGGLQFAFLASDVIYPWSNYSKDMWRE